MAAPQRSLFRLIAAAHVRLYRALRGRWVNRGAGGVPLLLLTTTGRRSGRPWTVPVGYYRDGHDLIVVAAGGVGGRHPAWALKARATPEAVVEVDGERRPVRATWLTGPELERLWYKVVATHPVYDRVRQSAGRIPSLLRLSPAGPVGEQSRPR